MELDNFSVGLTSYTRDNIYSWPRLYIVEKKRSSLRKKLAALPLLVLSTEELLQLAGKIKELYEKDKKSHDPSLLGHHITHHSEAAVEATLLKQLIISLKRWIVQ